MVYSSAVIRISKFVNHDIISFIVLEQKGAVKCLYSDSFWSVFSSIRIEYSVTCGKIRTRKTPNTGTYHAVTTQGKCEKICKINLRLLKKSLNETLIFCVKTEAATGGVLYKHFLKLTGKYQCWNLSVDRAIDLRRAILSQKRL